MERPIKRTTVILEGRDREYLEGLIGAGKEAGIKAFISKMFEVYRDLGMSDWRYPGVYHRGVSRVALLNQELLDIPISKIQEDLRKVGREMGEALSTTIQADLGIDAKKDENRPDVLRQLSVLGQGDFGTRDDIMVVKGPFISNTELLLGFLEGLLGKDLLARTTRPPVIIQVLR